MAGIISIGTLGISPRYEASSAVAGRTGERMPATRHGALGDVADSWAGWHLLGDRQPAVGADLGAGGERACAAVGPVDAAQGQGRKTIPVSVTCIFLAYLGFRVAPSGRGVVFCVVLIVPFIWAKRRGEAASLQAHICQHGLKCRLSARLTRYTQVAGSHRIVSFLIIILVQKRQVVLLQKTKKKSKNRETEYTCNSLQHQHILFPAKLSYIAT